MPPNWTIDTSSVDYVPMVSPQKQVSVLVFVVETTAAPIDVFNIHVESYREKNPSWLEVLELSTRELGMGDSTSTLVFQVKASDQHCVEEFREWIWVIDSRLYWVQITGCIQRLENYEEVLADVLDSFTIY